MPLPPLAQDVRHACSLTREESVTDARKPPQSTRAQIVGGNMPGHDSPTGFPLSGVIICPAYWKGQRLRANSITTNSITTWPGLYVNAAVWEPSARRRL